MPTLQPTSVERGSDQATGNDRTWNRHRPGEEGLGMRCNPMKRVMPRSWTAPGRNFRRTTEHSRLVRHPDHSPSA